MGQFKVSMAIGELEVRILLSKVAARQRGTLRGKIPMPAANGRVLPADRQPTRRDLRLERVLLQASLARGCVGIGASGQLVEASGDWYNMGLGYMHILMP